MPIESRSRPPDDAQAAQYVLDWINGKKQKDIAPDHSSSYVCAAIRAFILRYHPHPTFIRAGGPMPYLAQANRREMAEEALRVWFDRETAEKRWERQQRESCSLRWTQEQIEDLKGELNRRSRQDPLWQVCADALGSLQFDLVDAKRLIKPMLRIGR